MAYVLIEKRLIYGGGMFNITSCHISFNIICPICYAIILRASIALCTVLTGVA